MAIEVSFSSVAKTRQYATTPGVYRDSQEKGFALEVSPKGKAVWTVRVRSKSNGNKEVPPKVMDFEMTHVDGKPSTNYEQALVKARDIKKRAQMTEEELKAHVGHTLDEGFRLYLEERRVKGKPLGQATKIAYLSDYNRYLKPYAGRILKDTKAGFWADVLRPLHDKTPSHALSCQALLSGIYSHLIGHDYLEVNPLVKVRMQQFLNKPEARDTKVLTLDIPKFVENISNLRVRHSRDIVMLFLITGFRHRALLSMKWDCLNLEDGYYSVPAGVQGWKGFSGKVPLSAYAVEILGARKAREASEGALSEYVFPARDSNNKKKVLSAAELAELTALGISAETAPHRTSAREAVARCAAGLEYGAALKPHDLRRTFNSAVHLVMGGDLKACGALLCHKWITDAKGEVHTEMQLSANYAITEMQKLRADADRVVNFIRQISGQLPLTAENKALLERNGIDPGHFALAEDDASDE